MSWLGDFGSVVLGALYTYRIPAAAVAIATAVGLAWLARRRGWLSVARRHPRAATALLVPILASVLPLGWYLASPLVLSATVDEPPPVIAAQAGTPRPVATPPSATASASRSPTAAAPTASPSP